MTVKNLIMPLLFLSSCSYISGPEGYFPSKQYDFVKETIDEPLKMPDDNSLVSQLSTGQQKTIILLMYLSQCKYLSEVKSKQPILLLDEVCSHLDDVNRSILLTLIETFKLQIFMTGTSKNLFSFLSTNAQFCNITD